MGFNRHYKYAFSLTRERKTNMSTAALSDFVNIEAIMAIGLEQFHSDLKEEMLESSVSDAHDIFRIIIAIETILKEFMRPEDYFAWKLSSGLDLH